MGAEHTAYINSPVEAMASVQAPERLNACPLMNLRLCGCRVETASREALSLQIHGFPELPPRTRVPFPW